MLSQEHRAIISATVPVLQQGGETLTRHFCQKLFSEYPQVLPFFNQAHQHSGTQQRALANSILMYASNNPYDGQKGVPLSMTPEDPNPVPDLPKDKTGNDDWLNGTSAAMIFGVERSAVIDQLDATVTEINRQKTLGVRLFWWNSTRYPNPHRDRHIAYLLGYQPFKPKTTYKVTVNAIVSGAHITRDFSFTTR